MARKINKERYYDPDLIWMKKTVMNGIVIETQMKGYWNFRPMLDEDDPIAVQDLWTLTLTVESLLPATIIGMEYLGSELLAYLAGALKEQRDKFKKIYWRKEPDRTGKLFYGTLKTSMNSFPVYIFDDVFTSGSTIDPIIRYLAKHYIVPESILCFKNRRTISMHKGIEIKEIC